MGQKAFKKTDKDSDGTIALAQLKRLFKEHYNLYHEDVHHHEHEVPHQRADEKHFLEEATHFHTHIDHMGIKTFTFEQFHKIMHEFMDHKQKERATLLEHAVHLYPHKEL